MRYIHEDSIQTCLEYVSKSDILLLFLADKAGTLVYLSSLFKESLQYLNIRSEIEQSLEYVNMYGDYYEKSLELISLFYKGQITNWRSFLAILRSQMNGFNILSLRTKYQQESVGAIMDSNALTVYERIGDQMICKEYDGIATPENFSLDDLSSYVVQTYLDDENNEKLYYSLEKKTCYFLFKAGAYVFCFHLPLLGGWDQYKLQTYQEHIFNAILESKGYTYCYLIKTLLGGLINE